MVSEVVDARVYCCEEASWSESLLRVVMFPGSAQSQGREGREQRSVYTASVEEMMSQDGEGG